MSISRQKKLLMGSPYTSGKTLGSIRVRSEVSPSSSNFFRGFIDPRYAPPVVIQKKRLKTPGYHAHTLTSLNRKGDVANALRTHEQIFQNSTQSPLIVGQLLNASGRQRAKTIADMNDVNFDSPTTPDFFGPTSPRQKTPSKRPKPASSLRVELSEQISRTPPYGITAEVQSLKKVLVSTKRKSLAQGKTKSKQVKSNHIPKISEIEEPTNKSRRIKYAEGTSSPFPASEKDGDHETVRGGSSNYTLGSSTNGSDDVPYSGVSSPHLQYPICYSSTRSPEHDYPVLDEKGFPEGSIEAVNKYVHTALSDWLRKNKQNKSGSQTESKPPSSSDYANQDDEIISEAQTVEDSGEMTMDSTDALQQKANILQGKCKTLKQTKPKVLTDGGGSKIYKKPSVFISSTTKSPKKTCADASSETKTYVDENGNGSTSSVGIQSLESEIKPLQDIIHSSMQTQTFIVGRNAHTQVNRSLTVLPSPKMREAATETNEILVEIDCNTNPASLALPSAIDLSDLLALQPLETGANCALREALVPFSPAKLSEQTSLKKAGVAYKLNPSLLSYTASEELNELKRLDPGLLQSSQSDIVQKEDLENEWKFNLVKYDDNANNNNLITFPTTTSDSKEVNFVKAECGDKTSTIDLKAKEAREACNGNLGFLNGQVSNVGCTVSAICFETKDMTSIVTSFSGDTANNVTVTEEKECQLGTNPSAAAQPQQSYVSSHFVGNSGVSGTYSLIKCPAPLQRKALKSSVVTVDPLTSKDLAGPASTQTIDETTAMCQVGHSLTSISELSEEPWYNSEIPCEEDYIDSDTLLTMPETIVQSINELDLGTNIEKISDTISTTFKAVTDIIIELVNSEEEVTEFEVEDQSSKISLSTTASKILDHLSQPTSSKDISCKDSEDESGAPTPSVPTPNVQSSVHVCADLDPSLSETSV